MTHKYNWIVLRLYRDVSSIGQILGTIIADLEQPFSKIELVPQNVVSNPGTNIQNLHVARLLQRGLEHLVI